jgi:dUTP pyrophosphatase
MQFISHNSVSIYILNSFRNTLLNNTQHDRFMHLKIFVDSEDLELQNAYTSYAASHNQKIMNDPHFFDAGFDLFLPENRHFYKAENSNVTINKVDFNIKCCAKMHMLGPNDENKEYFTGFHTHPRSSLSKTPLRLANSTGIIDAGYRGNLIGMFDCIWSSPISSSAGGGGGGCDSDYCSAKFTRLLQICAPGLVPIYVEIVNSIEELGPNTNRGGGGFGSTGV